MKENRESTPAPKPRPWTTSEVAYLRRHAGISSVAEIGEKLGRSENAIRSKAAELRKQGEALSLRVFESPLHWCLHCATWRKRIFHIDGKCNICRLKERLEKSEERCRKELDKLPLSARIQYEEYEPYRHSIRGTRPEPPKGPYSSRYEQGRRECRFYEDEEEWEASYLIRRINANKSRLRRIKKRARSLCDKTKAPDKSSNHPGHLMK